MTNKCVLTLSAIWGRGTIRRRQFGHTLYMQGRPAPGNRHDGAPDGMSEERLQYQPEERGQAAFVKVSGC